MDNTTIYVIQDLDMHNIVGAYRTMGQALMAILDNLDNCDYENLSIKRDDDYFTAYLVHFPHPDPEQEGHWRIEEAELEGD